MNQKTFDIEKGIPLPSRDLLGRRTKYPFGEMEVGDSFYVADNGVCDLSLLQKRVRGAARRHGGRHGLGFTCHADSGGIRVWRVW